MLSRNRKVKGLICKILQQYRKGEVYTYCPENAQQQFDSVDPHYHNSVEWLYGDCSSGRRYRFNICEENRWNRINISEELENKIVDEVKKVLEENNIPYKVVQLSSYYPYMESRMMYASWVKCLEIYD